MNIEDIKSIARDVGGYDHQSLPSNWDAGDFCISPEQLAAFTRIVQEQVLKEKKYHELVNATKKALHLLEDEDSNQWDVMMAEYALYDILKEMREVK